jgi:hypothetical protein
LLRSEQAYLSLPPDAVVLLRHVVQNSRTFIAQTLQEGVADGTVRDDIETELLMVPVVATIHAVIGLRGAHRKASRGTQPDPERVLLTLARLIEPPDSGPASPRKTKRKPRKKETAT